MRASRIASRVTTNWLSASKLATEAEHDLGKRKERSVLGLSGQPVSSSSSRSHTSAHAAIRAVLPMSGRQQRSDPWPGNALGWEAADDSDQMLLRARRGFAQR